MVQDGFKSKADLQINAEGHSFSFELPSEEAFESLLMRFRHFWLQGEPCYFFNILKIVDRYVPDARSNTKFLKESWKKGMFQSTNIIIDGVPLTTEKLIDIWLNAEFFHNEKDKKDELDNLINKIELNPSGFVRFFLISSICQCCKVIFELNKLLAKAL